MNQSLPRLRDLCKLVSALFLSVVVMLASGSAFDRDTVKDA